MNDHPLARTARTALASIGEWLTTLGPSPPSASTSQGAPVAPPALAHDELQTKGAIPAPSGALEESQRDTSALLLSRISQRAEIGPDHITIPPNPLVRIAEVRVFLGHLAFNAGACVEKDGTLRILRAKVSKEVRTSLEGGAAGNLIVVPFQPSPDDNAKVWLVTAGKADGDGDVVNITFPVKAAVVSSEETVSNSLEGVIGVPGDLGPVGADAVRLQQPPHLISRPLGEGMEVPPSQPRSPDPAAKPIPPSIQRPWAFLVEHGLIFEFNRQVLNPLGLLLVLDGQRATLLDARTDPEGLSFDEETLKQGSTTFAAYLDKHGGIRATRRARFAYVVQPAPIGLVAAPELVISSVDIENRIGVEAVNGLVAFLGRKTVDDRVREMLRLVAVEAFAIVLRWANVDEGKLPELPVSTRYMLRLAALDAAAALIMQRLPAHLRPVLGGLEEGTALLAAVHARF